MAMALAILVIGKKVGVSTSSKENDAYRRYMRQTKGSSLKKKRAAFFIHSDAMGRQ